MTEQEDTSKRVITQEIRKMYHSNRKRKVNLPLIAEAAIVVNILNGTRGIVYEGADDLAVNRMRKKLLEWIFENKPQTGVVPINAFANEF